MGMFDWVTCKKPLPISEDEERVLNVDFQTKGWDCDLDHYHIDEYGYLFKEQLDYDTENGVDIRTGHYSPCNFSGPICFYGENPDPAKPRSIEFEAFFLVGKCGTIKRLA